MRVDELLKADRELTDEEFAFLEQELVKLTREFHGLVTAIVEDIEHKEPFLARRLRRASQTVLDNVEAASGLSSRPAPPDTSRRIPHRVRP